MIGRVNCGFASRLKSRSAERLNSSWYGTNPYKRCLLTSVRRMASRIRGLDQEQSNASTSGDASSVFQA